MRKLVGSALALCLAAVLVGACGGYSEQDATARCEQEATARSGGGCFDPSTKKSCIDAHEECGDEAVADDTACPLTYSCPQ
jgi:hypothetical protein